MTKSKTNAAGIPVHEATEFAQWLLCAPSGTVLAYPGKDASDITKDFVGAWISAGQSITSEALATALPKGFHANLFVKTGTAEFDLSTPNPLPPLLTTGTPFETFYRTTVFEQLRDAFQAGGGTYSHYQWSNKNHHFRSMTGFDGPKMGTALARLIEFIEASKKPKASDLAKGEKSKLTYMLKKLKRLQAWNEYAVAAKNDAKPDTTLVFDNNFGTGQSWKIDLSDAVQYFRADLKKRQFAESLEGLGWDIYHGTEAQYREFLVSKGQEWADVDGWPLPSVREIALYFAGDPNASVSEYGINNYKSQAKILKWSDIVKDFKVTDLESVWGTNFKPLSNNIHMPYLYVDEAKYKIVAYLLSKQADLSLISKPDYPTHTLFTKASDWVYDLAGVDKDELQTRLLAVREITQAYPIQIFFAMIQYAPLPNAFVCPVEMGSYTVNYPVLPGMRVHKINSSWLHFYSYDDLTAIATKNPVARTVMTIDSADGEVKFRAMPPIPKNSTPFFVAPYEPTFEDYVARGGKLPSASWEALEALESAVQDSPLSGDERMALRALVPAQRSLRSFRQITARLILAQPDLTDLILWKDGEGTYSKVGEDYSDQSMAPLFDNLVEVKSQHMGGGRPKRYYVDTEGRVYMAKPDPVDKFRPDAEHAANEVARMYGIPVPETAVLELDGVYSYVQYVRPAKSSLYSLRPQHIGFDLKTLTQVMVQHPVDWAVSNHDNHGGNMLFDKSGDVLKIDMGQAFKFLGRDEEVLKVGWIPQGNFDAVWYDYVYLAIGRGQVPAETLNAMTRDVLRKAYRVSNVRDKAYRETMVSAFKNRTWFPNGLDREAFVELAMERKHSVFADFFNLYKGLYSNGGYDFPFSVEDFETNLMADSFAHLAPSPQFFEEVWAAGAHGKPLFFAGRELEDAHALFYTTAQNEKVNLYIDAKVMRDNKVAANLQKWFAAKAGDSVIKPKAEKKVEKGPDPALNHLPMTNLLETLVTFAKTVSHHQKDGDYNKETVNTAKIARASAVKYRTNLEKEWAKSPEYVSHYCQTGHQQFAWYNWLETYIEQHDSVVAAMEASQKAPNVPTAALYEPPAGVDTSGSPKPVESVTDAKGNVWTKWSDYNFVAAKGPISEEVYEAGKKVKGVTVLDLTAKAPAPVEEKVIEPPPLAYAVSKSPYWTTPRCNAVDSKGVSLEVDQQQFHKQTMVLECGEITIQFVTDTGDSASAGDKTNNGRLIVRIAGWDGSDDLVEKAFSILREAGLELKPASEDSLRDFYWQHLSLVIRNRSHTGLPSKVQAAFNKIAAAKIDDVENLMSLWEEAFGEEVVQDADWAPRLVSSRAHLGDLDPAFGRPHWIRPDYSYADLKEWSGGMLPSRGDGHGLTYMASGLYAASEDKSRFRGWFGEGPDANSPTSDRGHGSSAYGYLRQGFSTDSGFHVEPHVWLRTHNYSFKSDKYGETAARSGSSPYYLREVIRQGYSGHGGIGVGNGANELLFKYNLSLVDDIAVFVAHGAASRKIVLDFFEKAGITELRGIPIKDRVVSNGHEAKVIMAKVWENYIESEKAK